MYVNPSMQEPQRLMATDIVALVRIFWPAPMNWHGFECQSRYQRPVLPDAATRRIRRRRSGRSRTDGRNSHVMCRFRDWLAGRRCSATQLSLPAVHFQALVKNFLFLSVHWKSQNGLLLCQIGIMLRPRSINPPPLHRTSAFHYKAQSCTRSCMIIFFAALR